MRMPGRHSASVVYVALNPCFLFEFEPTLVYLPRCEHDRDHCISLPPNMYLAYLPPGGSTAYSNSRMRQQGKVAELRLELNSGGKKDKNHSVKKVALKKIVANMTMSNNDMVALFPDIIGCMNIPSIEIKKM